MYASNNTCIAKFILNSCAPVGGDFQYHNGGQQQHQKTKKTYGCTFLQTNPFTPCVVGII